MSAGAQSNGSDRHRSSRSPVPAFAVLGGFLPPKKCPSSPCEEDGRVLSLDFHCSRESSPVAWCPLLGLAPITTQTLSIIRLLFSLECLTGSCERMVNYYNNSLFNPCPVFNVRVSFRVSPIQFERPNISTVIHWDLPHGTFNVIMVYSVD